MSPAGGGLFTAATVERVKESADIVEIVSAYTDLRRSGVRFMGLCPFHDERSPSFSVDPQAVSRFVREAVGRSAAVDGGRFVEIRRQRACLGNGNAGRSDHGNKRATVKAAIEALLVEIVVAAIAGRGEEA